MDEVGATVLALFEMTAVDLTLAVALLEAEPLLPDFEEEDDEEELEEPDEIPSISLMLS